MHSMAPRLVLSLCLLLAAAATAQAQDACDGVTCPDESTCEVNGAPVCVCDPDNYSRLLNGKCTAGPLLHWGYLDIQNSARAAVGSTQLAWNDDLASRAQEWADNLAQNNNCNMKLEGVAGIGQNLVNNFGDNSFSTSMAVARWVQQGSRYTYSRYSTTGAGGCRTGRSSGCAAYTQAIWNDSKSIGCAYARCPDQQAKVWVCNYSPAGNIAGQFPYIKAPASK